MESFWNGKKVLITGHTGFKGSWLSLWLNVLGANVIGYALEPPTKPNMFDVVNLDEEITSIKGDILDKNRFFNILKEYEPDIIFHLAAQSLVRKSYKEPLGTLETNIMGTANILECCRKSDSVKVVINVTSDKCYENRESIWGYRENDRMGGYDPYSCSKGCSELITSSFRKSFYTDSNKFLASVRAGNVIGGGDWSEDRLVPDIIKAVSNNKVPTIRYPNAIRPWQHVIEPLSGYMLLAEKMWNYGHEYSEGWNFGPNDDHIIMVSELTERLINLWNNNTKVNYMSKEDKKNHEAQILKLDSSKSKFKLGWYPKLSIEETLKWTVEWYSAYDKGLNMKTLTLNQIEQYSYI